MNKKGWGLRVELAFVLLFLICLIISTIGLYKMGLFGNNQDIYGDVNDSVNFDYNSLEKRVTEAATRYFSDHYTSNVDTVAVSTSTLKKLGYLTSIYDSRNKECKGYSIKLKTGNIVSYIKCSIYKTVGYNEDYE